MPDIGLPLKKQLEKYYEVGWEILDFIDLEMPLVWRLTDDDVGALLMCIDAKNCLKRLNLTYFSHVTGNGLEPLRCSIALNTLDFGEADFQEEGVIPILESILREEGNTFRRLRALGCYYYNESLLKYNHAVWRISNFCYFGFSGSRQEFVQNFAEGINCDEEDECHKCHSLSNYVLCNLCDMAICYECGEIEECTECEVITCGCCTEEIEESFSYDANKPDGFVNQCQQGHVLCDKCRLENIRTGYDTGYDCGKCFEIIQPKFLKEMDAKDADVESLQKEISTLREENDEKQATIDKQQALIDQLREEVERLHT